MNIERSPVNVLYERMRQETKKKTTESICKTGNYLSEIACFSRFICNTHTHQHL